jgi:hypothetical protein
MGLTRLQHSGPEWVTRTVPEVEAFSGHGCGEIFLDGAAEDGGLPGGVRVRIMGWGQCQRQWSVVRGQWSVKGGGQELSALHDLQNYFAVVFAGLEEFVGFFGLVEGEDVADLGS